VFVLPTQIAHGVAIDVALSINEELKKVVPENNIVAPIAMYNQPDKYAVVVFVQDTESLPPGHSSTWPEEGDSSASKRHSKHCDLVCDRAMEVNAFAKTLPQQCSRDARIGIFIPVDQVVHHTAELKVLGMASKYDRSRSVLLEEGAVVATFLDVRYVNPISWESRCVLEDLFKGNHVLSKFLFILPSEVVEMDSPNKCLYNKAPWFAGFEILEPLTEEEKAASLQDKHITLPTSDGGTVLVTVKGEKKESTHRWVYKKNTEFDHLPNVMEGAQMSDVVQRLMELRGPIPVSRAQPSSVLSRFQWF